jgi:hypothetical protein
MTLLQIRARLDRLERAVSKRTESTRHCAPCQGLNTASLELEDRGRQRILELGLRGFCGTLTQPEMDELAELESRFPPDPNDPLKHEIEAWGRAANAIDAEAIVERQSRRVTRK